MVRHNDPLERIVDGAKATGVGAAVAGGCLTLVGGAVVIGATLGAAMGALSGEVLDHVPYLNHAIPEGLQYLAAYVSPNAREAAGQLQGNLDKVGAAMGFIGGFYRSSHSCSHKSG